MADASSGVSTRQGVHSGDVVPEERITGGLMPALPVKQLQGEQVRRPYRVKQVADALGVSPAAIYREIETGRLGAYRIGKGALRVPHEAFEKYKAVITAAAATKRPAGVAG